MNLMSTLVGLSIAGIATPALLDMSLAPVIAQKRAANFAVAESQAVAFTAKNEWKLEENFTATPEGCSLMYLDQYAMSITCFQGTDKFRAEVTRSFRTPSPPPDVDDGNNGHGNDADGVDESNPGKSAKYCPYYDPLGEFPQFKGCIPVS